MTRTERVAHDSERFFYCADLPDDIMRGDDHTVELSEEEARHIARVLRLQPGEAIRVFDGKGRLFAARLVEVSRSRVTAKLDAIERIETVPKHPVHLLVGTPKGKKPDFIIEKAVELGVESVVFFDAERSVAQKSEKQDKVLSRWRKIIIAASKQSGRARLMRVEYYPALNEAMENLPDDAERLAFWEEAPVAPEAEVEMAKPAASLIGLIGPEGGLTFGEIETAVKADFRVCSLGPTILRAETAAIVAATLLLQRAGDIGIRISNS